MTSHSMTSPLQVVGRASAEAARPVLPAETWRDPREQGAQVSRDWWRAGHVTSALTSDWLQGADPGGGRGQQQRGAAAALHQESWDISAGRVQPRGRGRGLVSGGGVRVPRLPRGDGPQQRAGLLQVSPQQSWCPGVGVIWCMYRGSLLHRKFSDPGSRRPEPRLHYYRLKVFQDAVRTDIDEQ